MIQYVIVMEGEQLIIVCHYRICDWSLISEQMTKHLNFMCSDSVLIKATVIIESLEGLQGFCD